MNKNINKKFKNKTMLFDRHEFWKDPDNSNQPQNIKNICLHDKKNNKTPQRKPKVVVDIYDAANEIMFKQLEYAMFQNRSNDDKLVSGVQLTAFNIFRLFACELINEYAPDKYVALKNQNDKAAHILIYGFDKLGESLLTEAAHAYHFAHFKTTKITVVDSNIEIKKINYLNIQPNISKIVQVNFIDENVFWQSFTYYAGVIDVCFVTGDVDAKNYYIAHRLRQKFFSYLLSKMPFEEVSKEDISSKNLLSNPKIILASSHFDDVFEMIKDNKDNDFNKLCINVERMYQNVCNSNKLLFGNEIIDIIARQIYVYYSVQDKESKVEKKLFINEWEFLTDDEKDQNRWAARHMFIKLRFLNPQHQLPKNKDDVEHYNINKQSLLQSLDNVPKEIKILLAQWEHKRWMAEKYLTGFTGGEVLNDQNFYNTFLKTRLRWHECLVPWDNLSDKYKNIDKKLTDFRNILADLNFDEVKKS